MNKEKENIEITNLVGTDAYPDFVVSARHFNADKNIFWVSIIEEILNKNLQMKNYATEKIQHLIYIYLLYPENINGVEWKERKYYKSKEKKYFIDIKFPDYEKFCNANQTEALKIMAEQTLRGCELFLAKEKDFNYPKFRSNLLDLFHNQGWINI